MIYLDLTLNLTLLVALSIVSGFIERRWARHTRFGVLLQGILFGGGAVIGMLRPLNLGPGLIFDGRSVMLSLCAMFYGPLAGSVAGAMTILCRIALGGVGTLTGVLVVLSSLGIGLLAYFRCSPIVMPPSLRQLYLFGLTVHTAMLAMMFTLPGNTGLNVVMRIGFPVMLLYPLATILAGKILSDQVSAIRTMTDLQQTKQNLAITLQSIGDAVISTNLEGKMVFMNPVAEALTGWSQTEACGRPFGEVFCILDEMTRERVADPVSKVLSDGKVVGLANHTLLIGKDGTERPIADSAAPIRDAQGEITGVVLVFRDQSEQRRVQRLMQARLTLLEYATTHTLNELLTKALDEVGTLAYSPIGFYHFVEADQKTLLLQTWSTRTLKEFCRTEGKELHYGIDQAGVWADCVYEKKPVVHNDYVSLPHRKGLPEGHAELIRELVVPIIREGRVVAILGVGNKPTDYTEKDVETIAYLAEETWQIVDKKSTEELLQESEALFRNLFENHAAVKLIIDPDTGNIFDANQAAESYYGWPRERLRQMRIQDINMLSSEEVKQEMEKARTLKRIYFEFRHRRADGSIRNVAVFSSKIELKKKEMLHSIIHDITERKRAEEALRESEQHFRNLADSGQALIWASGADKKCNYFNKVWLTFTGRMLDQELGDRWAEGVHPDDLTHCVDTYMSAFDRRERFSMIYRLRRHDGVYRWLQDDGTPCYDSNGRFIGYIGHCLDITERKLAQERIEHLNNVLRAIRNVNQLTVRERDRNMLIREGCRLLVDSRGYTCSLIVLVDENDRPVSWAEAGTGGAFQRLEAAFGRGKLPHCCNHAQLSEEAVLIDDRKSICSKCPIATRCADTDSLCMRLAHGGTSFGYLAASMHQGLGMDAEERSLFAEMAGDLAYALYTLQTEEAREKSERERKSLKDQLLQAQKMESIGRLAGGVAHDYNNMLGVIIGYTEMALYRVDPADPLHADLKEILKAARRSADITRQLLAFARKQTISPVVLDLNQVVDGMLRMLRRLIGEDIDLAWLPKADLWKVRMDPSQIDQILANLCVNARDAIDGVGKVTIETGKVSFDKAYCADHAGFVPGEFVLLAVSDDGCGMDKETLDNIFEPFFTTKGVDQGTGLGLSTVYGIVKQNNGFINVYSEPGKGTTIKIYLPPYTGEAVEKKAASAAEVPAGQGETILLADDEQTMLNMGKRMLERLGYRVLAAATPGEAIGLARDHSGEIHMLITDVVMPEMNGRNLSKQLQSLYPNLKTLFMSGYTANVIAHRGVLDEGVRFIQKPFSMKNLAVRVRDVLDHNELSTDEF